MYKTPFKLLEWAFNIHLGGGLFGAVAKGVAVRAVIGAVSGAFSQAAGAGAKGAGGAATGGGSGSAGAPGRAAVGGGTIRSAIGGRPGGSGGGELGGKSVAAPRNSLPPGGGSEPKALPPASPEAVRKFLKDNGSSDDKGFGRNRRRFNNDRSRKSE
jgi:hypothetical protein